MKSKMPYTLIMPNGRIMSFYIKATAECYQTIYGGVIVTDEILNTEVNGVQKIKTGV